MLFCEYCESFKKTYYEEHLRRTLSLRKLAASALAFLINADYLLTGYDFISKKIDSCQVTKCSRFDIVLKLKTIHGRTYRNKTKKPC